MACAAQCLDLRRRATGSAKLRCMVMELVVRAVQGRHRTDGHFPQAGVERELGANGPQVSVPASGQRRAMQQHSVEVQQSPAAAGADRLDECGRLGEICGLIANARHT